MSLVHITPPMFISSNRGHAIVSFVLTQALTNPQPSRNIGAPNGFRELTAYSTYHKARQVCGKYHACILNLNVDMTSATDFQWWDHPSNPRFSEFKGVVSGFYRWENGCILNDRQYMGHYVRLGFTKGGFARRRNGIAIFDRRTITWNGHVNRETGWPLSFLSSKVLPWVVLNPCGIATIRYQC